MTIFRFRSAHRESLWTVPIFRQWPLSFRAFIQLRVVDSSVAAPPTLMSPMNSWQP